MCDCVYAHVCMYAQVVDLCVTAWLKEDLRLYQVRSCYSRGTRIITCISGCMRGHSDILPSPRCCRDCIKGHRHFTMVASAALLQGIS